MLSKIKRFISLIPCWFHCHPRKYIHRKELSRERGCLFGIPCILINYKYTCNNCGKSWVDYHDWDYYS